MSIDFDSLVDPPPKKEIHWIAVGVELTVRIAISVVSGYFLMALSQKYLSGLSPEEGDPAPSAQSVHARLARILAKRRCQKSLARMAQLKLNSYERQIAEDVLDPDDIQTCFADIGGLDNTKREIYELAVLPLLEPDLFTGKLVQPCKGILLFGKPGTGKTMLAKALAKEAEAVFITLQLSKILSKWVGESNKLIAATFSLACKLQPSIVFIDELDTFLKDSNTETAYLDSIKAEFLTLWDGVSTAESSRVLVLGATNKPQSIDPAILRRMPRAFAVPLPDQNGRLSILTLLLKDENVQSDILDDFLEELSGNMTLGYSGSDLKELCKAAAMVAVQERAAEFSRWRVMGELQSNSRPEMSKDPLRPMTKQDMLCALDKVKRTGAVAMEYGREEQNNAMSTSLEVLRDFLKLDKNRASSDDDDDIPTLK
jgi:ATPase family AAA domain-containing protein 1